MFAKSLISFFITFIIFNRLLKSESLELLIQLKRVAFKKDADSKVIKSLINLNSYKLFLF
jgi:hypothetical protein